MSDSMLSHAIDILHREGLVSLIVRSCTYVRQCIFRYGSFCLYEHSIEQRDEEQFRPKIKDFIFRIVTTNEQVDELVKNGFEDIRKSPVIVNVRKCLDNGAIAFCFFIEQELAHIGWIALNEGSKNCFDILPYRVHFAHKQACTGGTVSLPKYRGKGFMQYGYYKRFQFLQESGYNKSRNAVARGNTAAQKAHTRFQPKIYAKAYYLQVFGWKFWKELPLTDKSA